MTRGSAVVLAAGLFAIWTLLTYVLEGRIQTFSRPDATRDRLIYTGLANVLLGTLGVAIVIGLALRAADFPLVTAHGLAQPGRIFLMIVVAVVLAALLITTQRLPSRHPMVLSNAFAQVIVVSIAEVLVCWVALGTMIRNALGPGVGPAVIAIAVSAVAFGLYHYAHSPPFNSGQMVLMLTAVGLFTGVFFFVGGDLYSTIIFHNAFALRGVTQALANSGRLEFYERPRPRLIITAATAVLVLTAVDIAVMRPALHASLQ